MKTTLLALAGVDWTFVFTGFFGLLFGFFVGVIFMTNLFFETVFNLIKKSMENFAKSQSQQENALQEMLKQAEEGLK